MTKQSTYWYFTTLYVCPLCSKAETFRERRSDPKPVDPALRYERIESYDYCNS